MLYNLQVRIQEEVETKSPLFLFITDNIAKTSGMSDTPHVTLHQSFGRGNIPECYYALLADTLVLCKSIIKRLLLVKKKKKKSIF